MATRPIRQRYVDQVRLDVNGYGVLEFTMKTDFLLTGTSWRVVNPANISASNPTGNPTKQATANNTIDGDFFEGTYSGNQDSSGTMHMCAQGSTIRCEWTGGDANAVATLTLRGFDYPAGTGMDLYAASPNGPPGGTQGPSNPVVGGTTLIRDAIQSANFLTGSAGWQITRLGNAEFNNATIRGTFETDGANGAYIRVVNIVDSTGQPESVIIFRPGNTTGLVPDWLPDADIGIGMVRAYPISASGLLGRGLLVMEIDGVAWATGVGAPITYPKVVLTSPSFDGVNQANPVIRLQDDNDTGNLDIRLSGNVQIGAAGKQVSIPTAKFARENALINFPNTLTANTGVSLSLAADAAIFNNYGMWSLAPNPNRITLPRNGQYEAGVIVKFLAQAVAAGLRQVSIFVNGTLIADLPLPTTAQLNGFATTVHLTTRFSGSTGDFVTFTAFQNSGANLAIQTGSRGWVELIEST